jgi:uncharacterized protein YoxC
LELFLRLKHLRKKSAKDIESKITEIETAIGDLAKSILELNENGKTLTKQLNMMMKSDTHSKTTEDRPASHLHSSQALSSTSSYSMYA